MRRLIGLPALLLSAASVVSCGGGGAAQTPPVTYTATDGVVQKGPLVSGASVTAQELDAQLGGTAVQYQYDTTTDLGAFSPRSNFTSPYILFSASGAYFDEVKNAVSDGPITLGAVVDLSSDPGVNVNILTTLAAQRIRNLVTASRLTFAAARTQAESEVLAAFNIRNAGSRGTFGSLDIAGSTDGDHILAALSSVIAFGNTASSLGALVTSMQADIAASGMLTHAATRSVLAASSQAINVASVAANLTQKYASSNIQFLPSDITDWIDRDGDGLVGKYKYQVQNATLSSSFTVPAAVSDACAGTSVSLSAGQLAVNGVPVSGPVVLQKGDVVVVSPTAVSFPGGTFTAYLFSASVPFARVSFERSLVSLSVAPANPVVPVGVDQPFTATGLFSDGSQADLTKSAVWSGNAPSVATVDASSGMALAAAIGATTVTASLGGVTGSATLTVTDAVLKSIVVTPDSLTNGVGVLRQLSAQGTYTDGSTSDVTSTVSWISSVPGVGTVTHGLVTGVAVGAAKIAASQSGVTGFSDLTVNANVTTAASAVPNGIFVGSATLLQDGRILVAGGLDRSGASTAVAALFDPVLNAWSVAASMGTPRTGHVAVRLADGRVLVIGGYTAGTTKINLASAEVYDPMANTWSPVSDDLNASGYLSALLLPSGKVLALGGGSPAAGSDLYDPATNTWSQAGQMVVARATYSATLLPSGKVLVAGGAVSGQNSVSSAETYDPVSNTWSAVASMANARTYNAAVLLPSGKVLVAGGELLAGRATPAVVLNSAELYDPVANAWSPAANMKAASFNDTATVLISGKVLISGGGAGLYDPVANTWSPAAAALPGPSSAPFTAILLPDGAVVFIWGSVVSFYW